MYSMCRGGFTCLNPVIMSSFSPPPPLRGSQRGAKRSTGQGSVPLPPPPNLNDHQTAGYKGWAGFKLEHSLFILVGGLSLCICFYPCRSVRPLLYHCALSFLLLTFMQCNWAIPHPSGSKESARLIPPDVPLVI